MKPLRLTLFFTHNTTLQTWDEVGMFDREVALYLRLLEHNVRVNFVTYGGQDEYSYKNRIPGINILCNWLNWSWKRYEHRMHQLHGLALWRTDVIKTNQTKGGQFALRAANAWKKPLVARCGYMYSYLVTQQHGEGSPQSQQAFDLERQVFSAAKRVVVTAPAMVKDVQSRLPQITDRVRLIPNYVDTEKFSPHQQTPETDILFIGRLSPEKNIAALLEALQPLELNATIIGSGMLEDNLKAHFGDLNGRITWINRVPNDSIPAYLNRAKLFILPSHYEGHPKTLVEAMACGLPVIGTDVHGIREQIQHGKTGWLCQTDAASIREAITHLMDKPELCSILGHNARQYALDHFSLDRIVDMELEVLHEAAGR